MTSERLSRHAFFGISLLLVAGSAATTILWCTSMSAMDEMPMPGGWTMSMAWMRMPGQTWRGAAGSFVGMWVVMMVAMMLPSTIPMLSRYRQGVRGTGAAREGGLTALVGVAYFLVWTLAGAVVFASGVALATIEMELPSVARGARHRSGRRRRRGVAHRPSHRAPVTEPGGSGPQAGRSVTDRPVARGSGDFAPPRLSPSSSASRPEYA